MLERFVSGAGKVVARERISPDELCRLINAELAQYEVCGNCRLTAIQELLLANGSGCNWEPGELRGRNRESKAFLPVFAGVLQSFRARYDVA